MFDQRFKRWEYGELHVLGDGPLLWRADPDEDGSLLSQQPNFTHWLPSPPAPKWPK